MTTAGARIAVLMQDVRGGGYERMMLNLMREWSRAGRAVDLVLLDAAGEYLSLIPKGVRLVDLRTLRASKSLLALVRYLRTERPRALLSGLAHMNALAAASHVMARAGNRLVLSERNTPSSERECGDAATRLGYRVARWAYRRADAVIAVSEGVAADTSRSLGVPRRLLTVIPNPVVTDELLQLAAQPCLHPWFAPGEPPVILAVGRLAQQKDHLTLLEAFAIARRDLHCRLVIIGEGGERGALLTRARELAIEQDLALPGFDENPYAMMAHCSVFVLSSAYEGSPNVLVEAMACGAKVVSTDCPHGPREILRDGTLAPMVRVGDVKAMAAAILRSLRESRASNELRSRASDYDATQSARRYLTVLDGPAISQSA